MASPAVSTAGGGARLQRAKRELDADTIRELIESRQQAPSNDERPLYDYNDYGAAVGDGEYAVEQNPDEIGVEAGESAPGGVEEGPYVQGDNVDDYFTEDDRRPKRRGDDDDRAEEEEEEAEEEEAYEEAEREVVRELLAERAAEETRLALLAYLSGGPNVDSDREYRRRRRDRFDQDTVDEDDDEEDSYEAEDEDNEGDEGVDDGESEEIDENDDRLDGGPFLPNEGPELVAKSSSIEQKRFAYPYTYEPYGGRWGALVPGAKRGDRDPYDRLYRLAEALSRPASISRDEYEK